MRNIYVSAFFIFSIFSVTALAAGPGDVIVTIVKGRFTGIMPSLDKITYTSKTCAISLSDGRPIRNTPASVEVLGSGDEVMNLTLMTDDQGCLTWNTITKYIKQNCFQDQKIKLTIGRDNPALVRDLYINSNDKGFTFAFDGREVNPNKLSLCY